jgi:hypothetical protein
VDKIAQELKSIRADNNSAIARAARSKIINAAWSLSIPEVPELNFLAMAQGLVEFATSKQLMIPPNDFRAIIPAQPLYQTPEFKMEIDSADALHKQGKPTALLSRQLPQLMMPAPLAATTSGEPTPVPLSPPLSASSSASSSSMEEVLMEGTLGDPNFSVAAPEPPSMFGTITRVPTPMLRMDAFSI